MKTFCIKNKLFFIFTLLIIGISNYAMAESSRIAIIPFKINAEKDLSFLRDGIVDMLTSRLSLEGRTTVVSKEKTATFINVVNQDKAREIGVALRADYVLFGSLTVFGNSMSIDAKMVDISKNKPTIAFFEQTRGMDNVISKINLFATNINEKMFDQIIVPTKISKPQKVDNIHAHPDKLIGKKFEVQDTKTNVSNSTFIISENKQKTLHNFWKSKNFNYAINGLALGDTDQDGDIETIVAATHAVYVYEFEGKRFGKIQKIASSRHKHFIGIDVADINGNGYPEIFATCLNANRNVLSSMVFEYDGQNYKQIISKSPWYYRVVEMPKRGKVLFGQKQKTGGPNSFSSAIFEMAWQNGEYAPNRQALSRKRANLMGFAIGDALNKEENVVVAYNRMDYIRIIDQSNEVIWSGSEHYGGSNLYFSMPKIESGSENRQYFPMRILINDIDLDGKYEVIAVKNHEITGRLLKRFRKFKSSQIESLSWDGLGLATNWTTQTISGCISDYAIGDFDNDGQCELVAIVVNKKGILLTKSTSSIIAYDLNN